MIGHDIWIVRMTLALGYPHYVNKAVNNAKSVREIQLVVSLLAG